MPYNTPTDNGSGIAAVLGAGLLIYLIIILASIVLGIIIWWKIFSKAGYSGAMSLLMFVPVANLIVLLVLAFGRWPIYNELEALRQQVRERGAGYPAANPQAGFGQPGYQSGPNYPSYPQGPQNPQYPRQ